MREDQKIQEIREQIAEITKQIIRLTGSRNKLARRVGELKRRQSLSLENTEVEEALLGAVLREGRKAGVDDSAALKMLNILLSESKRSQRWHDKTDAPSPMAVFAKAKELERKGEKLIRLDVGEPDFKPPAPVVEACIDALVSSKTHYTEPRGIPELVAAVQRYVSKTRGYKAENNQIVVTPGGRFAIFTAFSSILKEGESCVVIDPSWPAYKEALQQIGVRPIVLHTRLEEGWEPDLEELKAAIRPGTKAIVLNYPSNPTGKIIRPNTFKEIVAVANEKGLTVVSDEIYNDYAYADCPSILSSGSNSFVFISSFSKSWAMTGFRVGFAVSSPGMVSGMLRLTSLMITSVPEFIQYGAVKALDSAASEVRRNSKAMRKRIDAACSSLDEIPKLSYYRPDGAMYVFPRIHGVRHDGDNFAAKLLDEKQVTVTPGSGFGGYPEFFRISLGNSEGTIVDGITRIGELLR